MTVILMHFCRNKLHSPWFTAVVPGIATDPGSLALDLVKLLIRDVKAPLFERGVLVDRLAVDLDRALIRGQNAREQAQIGRFARAVRADQTPRTSASSARS